MSSLSACLHSTAYTDKARVQADAAGALRAYPGLYPEVDSYTSNTGVTSQLLALSGTIPVTYRGSTYNIPVRFWVPEAYPDAGPIAYVTPTSGMFIKSRHQHVDMNGLVYCPYLNGWSTARSSLEGLAASLSALFAKDPPVRAGRPGEKRRQASAATTAAATATPTPTPAATATPAATGYQPARATPYGQPVYDSSGGRGGVPSGHWSGGGGGGSRGRSQAGPASQGEDDAVAILKAQFIKDATAKTQERMQSFFSEETALVDIAFAEQQELRSAKIRQEHEVNEIAQQRAQMQAQIQSLEERQRELDAWLAENDTNEEVDIDAVTQPPRKADCQLLEAVAIDNAIEDVLYELGTSLNNGDIPLAAYLKNLRQLTKKQFKQRALINKIRGLQQQAASAGGGSSQHLAPPTAVPAYAGSSGSFHGYPMVP